MQIYPTRTSVDLALAGSVVVAIGMAAAEPAIVAWGGALLVGLAVARAVTLLSVARVRTSGLEMLWRDVPRPLVLARTRTVEIEAEVRNRDGRAARYVELRCVHAPELRVELDPPSGEVPASGRLKVTLRIHGERVGRFALHALSLEVRGAPGLFEVPLSFANPLGVQVMPSLFATNRRGADGYGVQPRLEVGRVGRRSGEGVELREIREHQTGDPFKRIAWKASARRGKLLVRDFDIEENERVWLVLDASVELWAGLAGEAPLDRAIDELCAVAEAHLARHTKVGLAIVAERTLCHLPPSHGRAQLAAVTEALLTLPSTFDSDRSEWDAGDVAARVLEHLRQLDASLVRGLTRADPERIARRAASVLDRAPFQPRSDVRGASPSDASLRSYLSAFGIAPPARVAPERSSTEVELGRLLSALYRDRPAPSLIYVWSPAPLPAHSPGLYAALGQRPRRGTELRWVSMSTSPDSAPPGIQPEIVHGAIVQRAATAQRRGEQSLRTLGIRVEPPGHPARVPRIA